jgi:DNA-directed RNA polymerase specialized sigma24 family protein
MDINEEAFEIFLQRLEPKLSDSKARYKNLRLKMTRFFEWKRCQDAEDLADETINRTMSFLILGKEIHAENPYSYIYGVANNIYKEYVRKQIKREKLIRDLPDRLAPAEDLQDCRIQCLQKLPPEKLKLLNQYYLNVEERDALPSELGLTVNALRLQIHRLKKELKLCHEECRKKLLEN